MDRVVPFPGDDVALTRPRLFFPLDQRHRVQVALRYKGFWLCSGGKEVKCNTRDGQPSRSIILESFAAVHMYRPKTSLVCVMDLPHRVNARVRGELRRSDQLRFSSTTKPYRYRVEKRAGPQVKFGQY